MRIKLENYFIDSYYRYEELVQLIIAIYVKIKIEKSWKNLKTSLSYSKTQRVKLAQSLSHDWLTTYEISKKKDIRTVNKYLNLNANTMFPNNKLDKKYKDSISKKKLDWI